MRTTLNVREDLFDELLQLTGESTWTAAVNRALNEYVSWRRRQAIKGLTGRIRIDLDWRELRRQDDDEA